MNKAKHYFCMMLRLNFRLFQCFSCWMVFSLNLWCPTEIQIVGIVSLLGCFRNVSSSEESACIAGKWGQAFAAAAACNSLTDNRPACQFWLQSSLIKFVRSYLLQFLSHSFLTVTTKWHVMDLTFRTEEHLKPLIWLILIHSGCAYGCHSVFFLFDLIHKRLGFF